MKKLKRTNKKLEKSDQQEVAKLAGELRAEVQQLEGTHPQLVQAVNALCLLLSRLGI